MNNAPFFSIIMPTRNRARLIPLAIQSVIEQDFNDFELIISNNFSDDETEQVVKGFNDSRIRYFKTSKLLPIDLSFEFALSHAKGKYVTFLPDDDAYTINRLKICFDILSQSNSDMLVHKCATYYPTEENPHNIPYKSLRIGWFSNQYTTVDSKKLISNLYNRIPSMYYSRALPLPSPFFHSPFPILINAFYKLSILNVLKNKFNRLIKTRSGDLYFGIIYLNQIKEFIYLDSPLAISRLHSDQTTGKAHENGKNDLIAATDSETEFRNVPFKLWTERNAYIDILLEALKDDNDGIGANIDLNWENYYRICYEDLCAMKNEGTNIENKLVVFNKIIDSLSKNSKEDFFKWLSNINQNEKTFSFYNLLRKIPQSDLILRFRMLFSKNPELFHARCLVLTPPNIHDDILFYSRFLDKNKLDNLALFWQSRSRLLPPNSKLI